jgi:hypothetical protein
LFTGETWFDITMELAEYFVDYLENNNWFYSAFIDALAPDRMFFNTLAVNSPYRGNIVNRAPIFEVWGGTYKTSNHPIIFTNSHKEEIENSDCFFARKFDINLDREIIEYFVNKIVT